MTWRIEQGDALAVLGGLETESVQCAITSPPYWGLRAYLPEGHPDLAREIGREETPEAWCARLVEVFREVRRVLRRDGTFWLNVGNAYAGSWGNQGRKATRGGQRAVNGPMLQPLGGTHALDCDMGEDCSCSRYPVRTHTGSWVNDHPEMKPKDLIGLPWMLAFALRKDGWFLRSEIIWHKRSCMPESVTDRPTRCHEQVFLLSKRATYYYDAKAIREPATYGNRPRHVLDNVPPPPPGDPPHTGLRRAPGPEAGRNKRTVWTLGPEPFPEAHFATFPTKLVEPMILASTSTAGASCLVLDPFCGSGTTGVVARRLGRDFLGIDLNEAYCEMARRRIGSSANDTQLELFP